MARNFSEREPAGHRSGDVAAKLHGSAGLARPRQRRVVM
jgi:hypothetical protein